MKTIYENVETQFMMINNGKFAGGRMIVNPIALINDGYMELLFYTGNWN